MNNVVNRFNELLSRIYNSFPLQVVVLVSFGLLVKLSYFVNAEFWSGDLFFYIQGAKTIADGGVLYRDFGDIKPPGIFFLTYIIIKIFSYKYVLIGLKVFNVAAQFLSGILFIKIGSRLYDNKTGFYLGLFYLFAVTLMIPMWTYNIMLFAILFILVFIYIYISQDLKPNFIGLILSGFFVGLACIFSTNFILVTLLIPITALYREKKIFPVLKDSLFAFLGFIIPFLIFFVYCYKTDSLNDAYWWTIKWASIYGGSKPVYVKVYKFFAGMIESWPLIPVYFGGFWGLAYIFKNRLYRSNNYVFFLLCFATISLFVRLMLGKGSPRYYLYLMPSFILIIPLLKNNLILKKNIIKIVLSIFFLTSYCLVIYESITNPGDKRPIYIQTQKVIKNIQDNSSKNDKIFVWGEGFDIYYKSDRNMATSIYSTCQHLTNTYIWEKNNFKDYVYPWNHFMEEFKRDKPKLIINLSGYFDFPDDDRAIKNKEPFVENIILFRKYVEQNYIRIQMEDGSSIWKLK